MQGGFLIHSVPLYFGAPLKAQPSYSTKFSQLPRREKFDTLPRFLRGTIVFTLADDSIANFIHKLGSKVAFQDYILYEYILNKTNIVREGTRIHKKGRIG